MSDTMPGKDKGSWFKRRELLKMGSLTTLTLILNSCKKEKNSEKSHILKVEDGQIIQYPNAPPMQDIVIRYPPVPRGANPKLGKIRYRHNKATPPISINLAHSIEKFEENREKPIKRECGEILSTELWHIQEKPENTSPTLVWEAAGQRSRITGEKITTKQDWIAFPVLVPVYDKESYENPPPIEIAIVNNIEKQTTPGLAIGRTSVSKKGPLIIDLVGYVFKPDRVNLTPFVPVT